MDKPYEFRKLQASDLFLVINLIKKVGLNNLAAGVNAEGIQNMTSASTDEDYKQVGIAVFEIAQVVIERIADCEEEIYKLLEATSNLTEEQIRQLDMLTFIQMVADFVKQKEFAQLFTQVVSLLNMGK